MEFENAFEVTAPIDEVYATLIDVAQVAPCVPGAEVLEQTGEKSYKVAIKVKVGPIRMQYKGDVEILSEDAATHTAVLNAKARETRGQGTADAAVTMRLSEDGPTTRGVITSDVKLSGRAAAMGASAIKDVSGAMIEDFAKNLAAMLAERQAGGAPAAGDEPGPTGAADAEAPPAPDAQPQPQAEAKQDDALSAGRLVKVVVLGRLRDPRVSAVLAGALAFVVARLLPRRR